MKVNKKYNNIVSFYTYNPISDCHLFSSITVQHFYTKDDVKNKKDKMNQYIYWFNDPTKSKKVILKDMTMNETINPNIKTLEQWCNKQYNTILYDSD